MNKNPRYMTSFSPKRRKLFEARLKEEQIEVLSKHAIPRRNTTTSVLPLSFAQEQFWFLDQLMPGNVYYNVPLIIRIAGRLDITVLAHCLQELVQRHEALRTNLPIIEGQPMQVITISQLVSLPTIDLRTLSGNEIQETEVQRLAQEEATYPFDLNQGPLLRATLLRLDHLKHVLLVTMHHIVCDGWSLNVLSRELVTLYDAFSTGQSSPLPELPIQYADFALWQRDRLQSTVLQELLNYWRNQLVELPPPLWLPTIQPHPNTPTFRGAIESFLLPQSVQTRLEALSRQEGATLYMTLMAAFKKLLFRYTEQQQIAIGSVIAGRTNSETENLIGSFVNTLVLCTDLGGNPTFRELLAREREVALGAYAHQELPFERLVEDLRPERTPDTTPLLQIVFAQQLALRELYTSSNVSFDFEAGDNGHVQFDLEIRLMETPEGLRCFFKYSIDRFDASIIKRMQGHYLQLLEGIAADPDQRLTDLPLLTSTERQCLLVQWNNTKADYPREQGIHELFEAQVERTPDSIAIIFEGKTLTYQELNQQANLLAHHLRGLGVGPEILVGICIERSIQMIIGLLGVLKAGGAYVPLDPDYPTERINFILENAHISVLLYQGHLLTHVSKGKAKWVEVDSSWKLIAQGPTTNPANQTSAENLAYVMYTSGSTGRPKGVAISHRNAVAFLGWARKVFSPTQLDGVLASTSICFDLSVFELFASLVWGGKVILAKNALQLAALPEGIRLVNTVPSVMAEIIRNCSLPPSICTVNLAGEPLSHKLVQQLYQFRTIKQVYNLYGPSECTTYSTYALIPKESDLPPTIGRPINNTEIYLLDKHLNPIPVGVQGELYIGGEGLARGYLHRPELTAERFIPSPFNSALGSRLYRTGDLARYRPDGTIVFLGRIDYQVKIRGLRTELREIETVLSQHPTIQKAVVVAREDHIGDKHLVAYVVLSQDQHPTSTDLRQHLKRLLPDYMVPAIFVVLDELPLTRNGKIDRNALLALGTVNVEREEHFVAPRSPLEKTLATIWVEVLKLEQIGIYDDFFELGGHSLLVTRVTNRIRDVFNVEIPLRAFFEAPTIAQLSTSVAQSQHAPKNNLIRAIKKSNQVDMEQLLIKLDQLTDDEVNLSLRQIASENEVNE